FLDPLQCLILPPEKPERPRSKTPHRNSRVLRIPKRVIEMSLVIVKRECLLKMVDRQSKLSEVHVGDLHSPMTSHRKPRVWKSFSKPQDFFSNLASRTQLRTQRIKGPQSPQHLRYFGRLAQALAQFAGPRINATNSRRGVTLRRD